MSQQVPKYIRLHSIIHTLCVAVDTIIGTRIGNRTTPIGEWNDLVMFHDGLILCFVYMQVQTRCVCLGGHFPQLAATIALWYLNLFEG